MRSDLQDLRGLRYSPPGLAAKGARRVLFQASMEQFEQFMRANDGADYATKPVQLFYALSQASRAVVAASPRIDNQSWRAHGHGISANTEPSRLTDVTVTANKSGLFCTLARAIGFKPLVTDEEVALRDLWPAIPETAMAPLAGEGIFSTLLFTPDIGPAIDPYVRAELSWIRQPVKDAYEHDPAGLYRHLRRYPSLAGALLASSRLTWRENGTNMWEVRVEWDVHQATSLPIFAGDPKSIYAARYDGKDNFVIAPAIGSMTTPLHPILAWWAVLLALSSLARYEPANWSKMIDVDRSREALSIEHLLNTATRMIPPMVREALRVED